MFIKNLLAIVRFLSFFFEGLAPTATSSKEWPILRLIVAERSFSSLGWLTKSFIDVQRTVAAMFSFFLLWKIYKKVNLLREIYVFDSSRCCSLCHCKLLNH